MVSQLQSEVLFLRLQLKSKENYFFKEIEFLREQLKSASSLVRRDKSFFFSWRNKVTVRLHVTEMKSHPRMKLAPG